MAEEKRPPFLGFMTTARRRFLITVLIASLGTWLLFLGIEYTYREEQNHSLIEDGLYLGGAVAKPPRGTRAVLNLCEQDDPYSCESHTWEPIRDAAPAPSTDWLRQMVELVESNRRAGLTTFVHCRNGVSRSGMVVTAYLMFKNGWSRDEALAFVRTKRPIVRPNAAFMKLLAEWERTLKGPAASDKGKKGAD